VGQWGEDLSHCHPGSSPGQRPNEKGGLMNKLGLIVIVFALAACSTGVVQVDKDTYMVSEKAAGCGFATAGGQEADAYKKANEYCKSRGQEVEVVSTTAKEGVPFARCASATVKFKCVPKKG
jgi:hypothetical protein